VPRPHRRRRGEKLADRREKLVARALAAPADFGAEPAVLVVRGVPVALLGTGEAGDATRFDHRADKAQVRRGLAGHNSAGRVADVGAVEAEANAAHHLPNVVLSEIVVGTTRTAGGTIEALVDAAQHGVAIESSWVWMQLEDLVKGHVSPFLRAAADPRCPLFKRCETLHVGNVIGSADSRPVQLTEPACMHARLRATIP
jgi:hypothetical protein